MFKFYRLHYLVALLLLIHIPLFLLPSVRYSSLVIHHTASEVGDYKTIQRAHLKKFGGMAYHLVLSNGSASAPTGHLESGWRYFFFWYSRATRSMSCNTRALHLCIVGNYEDGPFPEGLKPPLAGAIRAIQDRYHIPTENIQLHRDCSATACPGKHIRADLVQQWLALETPDQLQIQHKKTLGRAFFLGMPVGPLILLSPFSLLLVWVWVRIHKKRKKV